MQASNVHKNTESILTSWCGFKIHNPLYKSLPLTAIISLIFRNFFYKIVVNPVLNTSLPFCIFVYIKTLVTECLHLPAFRINILLLFYLLKIMYCMQICMHYAKTQTEDNPSGVEFPKKRWPLIFQVGQLSLPRPLKSVVLDQGPAAPVAHSMRPLKQLN